MKKMVTKHNTAGRVFPFLPSFFFFLKKNKQDFGEWEAIFLRNIKTSRAKLLSRAKWCTRSHIHKSILYGNLSFGKLHTQILMTLSFVSVWQHPDGRSSSDPGDWNLHSTPTAGTTITHSLRQPLPLAINSNSLESDFLLPLLHGLDECALC